MAKNYYDILGITADEKKLTGKDFEKVLKKKFRSISLRYHPDRQGDKSEKEKKDAEEKFKEAAEAYDVLLNKREEYDNPITGGNGFSSNFDFSNFNMDDIFRDFGFGGFGGFGNSRANVVKKGSSLKIKVALTLKEMYDGAHKKLKYNRLAACGSCNGKGTTDNSKTEKCHVCGGTGKEYSNNGFFQTITTCHRCHGKGTVITNPCPKCNGRGVVSTQQDIEIDIPKGAFQGMSLTMQGYGNAPDNMDGLFGDLIIEIYEKQDNTPFLRNGHDLHRIIEIPVIDAILGSSVIVETINGKKLTAKIAPGTEDGYTMRFVGYGMPIYGTNNYGNMFCRIKLKMPKNLTSDDIKRLENIRNSPAFK